MDEEVVATLSNYIRGRFVEHDGSEWMDVVEPATGAVFAKLPLSGSQDVDAAVEAAREAQPGWASLGVEERADWLESSQRRLARERVRTLENLVALGRPIYAATPGVE